MTWILIPPESPGIFTIIMLFFYYSLGNSLEQTWGAFRYNVYIFMGMISTVLGAFISCMWYSEETCLFGNALFSTYYINMSIFLAVCCYVIRMMQVMLYFFHPYQDEMDGYPVRLFYVYSFVKSSWVGKVAIIASLLNFIVFFLMTRDYRRVSPKEIRRKKTSDTRRTPQSPETADSLCTNVLCADGPSWTGTIWSSVTAPSVTEITSIVRIISLPTSMSIKNSEVKGL